MIRITNSVQVSEDELEFKATLSQGSGGQHVNKVSTAIQLFFGIRESTLPERVKDRLMSMNDHRITPGGQIVIKSQDSRSQEANRQEALAKFKELLAAACVVPKKRRPTKPSKGAKERRLKSKAIRGKTKSLRGRASRSDW
ncbi:alternative ribosome rescue aminoacyl-tRNA hydrolase ArfB [Pelagicoccus albus]|uniref:Aminoacyl-tRNA hydrolase n=1 Tax=Pelagicoccus albus TaxID=415222 RepID=A0A7X1B6N3_9BACT|nr:alternative ribosome rescue aminoacyl-tRNA hydrolase ArfB [Pelagicoccus albus]MBC2606612.1 aminoacyl-tRNA hydrolase [Pelagicoccus albus]